MLACTSQETDRIEGGSNTELNSQSILKRENIFLVTQWELDGGIVDSILERLRNGWRKV